VCRVNPALIEIFHRCSQERGREGPNGSIAPSASPSGAMPLAHRRALASYAASLDVIVLLVETIGIAPAIRVAPGDRQNGMMRC
jgi:hypothetical protein